jgi:hypothetical protein
MHKNILGFGILLGCLLFGNLPLQTAAQTETAVESGFHLVQATENGIIIEYSLGEYALEKVDFEGQTYDRVVLKDASTIADPGKPDLPVVATSIGVPINADFNLHIEEIQTRLLSGRYRIAPAGSYVVDDEALASGKIVYVEDQETYASATAYPGIQVELGQAAKLRSQRILPLRVYPFQFTPSSGQLEVVTYVRFVVEFVYPQGKSLFESSTAQAEEDNPFEALYQQSLLNYQEAKRYRAFEPSGDSETQPLSEVTTGESYKITVTEDGIYKLTYETLQAAGMPVNTLDPQTFAMTNQGRPVAIYVHNSDGNPAKFSSDEYILFFGERFDGTYLASLYSDEDDFWRDSFYRSGETSLTPFQPKFNRTMVEKYTNQNVYWLTYSGNGGPFMETMTVSQDTMPYLSSFRQSLRFEEQNIWWTTHFTSEDTFFWDSVQFSANTRRDYSLIIPTPTQTGSAILRGEFVARAHNPNVNPDHRQAISLNRNQIGTLSWDGLRRYRFELTFPASYLSNNGNNTLTVEFQKVNGMTIDQIFVDWFEIVYERRLVAQDNQISINRPSSSQLMSFPGVNRLYLPLILRNYSAVNSIQIEGFTQSPIVLQIGDPLNPKIINGATYGNGVIAFENPSNSVINYFVAAPQTISAVEKVIFENITGPRADYIYITPKAFVNSVQSLANYRQTKDGFTTKVVALEEIINQFNFGIYHPRAIRNYLQSIYDQWDPKPVYVLLVGDGHWNFLGSSRYDNPPNYMPPNLQWVDPWQGEVDSANDLVTVDGWDPLPDMLIGRLPVNNAQEILDYLAKVQAYESDHGEAWQKRFVFVADANDPEAGNFPQLTDKIIADYSIADYRKIYLMKAGSAYSTYDTETTPDNPCGSPSGGNQCPNATTALVNLLKTVTAGHLVYSGHGYIDGWSKAVIFSNLEIQKLNNASALPFVFTLDCLDGYWFYPQLNPSNHRGQSIIELLVRTQAKGAVGAFAPTGLGVATAHDTLQRGFYNHIFFSNNPWWRLGAASLKAKLKVYQDTPLHVDLVHTYTIFGDPALILPALNTP